MFTRSPVEKPEFAGAILRDCPAKVEVWRRLAVVFLILQSAGVAVWWAVLLTVPRSREPFLARPAPDSTLLAFALPDALLFVGAGMASGMGLAKRCGWAWPVLCVHAGAAIYAALYCGSLALLTGQAWAGAILMTPSLVLPPLFVWKLRPRLSSQEAPKERTSRADSVG